MQREPRVSLKFLYGSVSVGRERWGPVSGDQPFLSSGEKPGLGLEILSALSDRAGRPLLIKGGNSSGPEFLGWASLDFITCQVPFSLLKFPKSALGNKVWDQGWDKTDLMF